jgi:large subunit ribosomal protein L15
MDLAKITSVGRNRKKVRVGRGSGSGLGKTSGRGHKGAGARSGFGGLLHREGGQMPLIRRIPKRGFRNTMFRVAYDVVNLDRLVEFKDKEITPDLLAQEGVTANRWGRLKVLARGDISVALRVQAHAFSAPAREKIEKAGGTATVIGAPAADAKSEPAAQGKGKDAAKKGGAKGGEKKGAESKAPPKS